jgi:hypothetical protein
MSIAAGERFSVAFWGNNIDFEIGLCATLRIITPPQTSALSELLAHFVSVTARDLRFVRGPRLYFRTSVHRRPATFFLRRL